MSAPIVLYDIPGKNAKYPGWSPSTWKTRYALAFKGLSFKTEWIEYPDIESTCKKIGAKPTRTKIDGSPLYTVPIIYDPNTKTVVEDSMAIAKYLDRTYPDTPRLFPINTFVVQRAFMDHMDPVIMSMAGLTMEPIYNNLHPVSAEYFRGSRYETMGKPFDAWIPKDEDGQARVWDEVEAGLGRLANWFAESENTGPFVMGDTTTYADIDLAARLIWVKVVLGEESEGWKRLEQLHGGRWANHLDLLETYENLS